MSRSSHAPQVSEEQAPFTGHPFGGLVREDRFGVPVTSDDQIPREPDNGAASQAQAADDWAGGFDFHLGVYARF